MSLHIEPSNAAAYSDILDYWNCSREKSDITTGMTKMVEKFEILQEAYIELCCAAGIERGAPTGHPKLNHSEIVAHIEKLNVWSETNESG